MGYNLVINGVYWGYNPLTSLVLTSWDILVKGWGAQPLFPPKPSTLHALQQHRAEVPDSQRKGEATRIGASGAMYVFYPLVNKHGNGISQPNWHLF